MSNLRSMEGPRRRLPVVLRPPRAVIAAGAVLVVLLGFLPSPAELGAQNGARMVPLESQVYGYMEALYASAGLQAPNTARPWSAGQTRRLLERALARGADPALLPLADLIRAELEDPPRFREQHFAFDLDPLITAEGFYALRSRSADPGEEESWLHGYRERLPQLALPLEFFYGDGMYIIADFALREEWKATRGSYGAQNYLNWFDPTAPKIDGSFPLRAFGSWSGDWWFLQLGREQHSWGNGRADNLLLSDESDFLDGLNFRLFSPSFAFSGLFAALDPWLLSYSGGSFDSLVEHPHLYFMAHRLEAVFWERLTIGLTEALMLAGDPSANGGDHPLVRYLNFFYPFHNWYESDLGNSILSVEADWRPAPGLGLYGQLVMDEFRTSYEASAGTTEPNIWGWLLGVDFSTPWQGGVLSAYGEYAHTDPFLYVFHKNGDTRWYNVRRYDSYITGAWVDIIRPMGFSLGPDARALTLQLQYERPGRWTAALEGTYSEQGEADRLSVPTETAISEAYSGSFPSGTAERSLQFHLSGEYQLTAALALQADSYWRYRWNIEHISGVRGFDLEFALGMRYRL